MGLQAWVGTAGRTERGRYGHADVRLGEGGVQMFLEFPSRIRSSEQDALGGELAKSLTSGEDRFLPF